MEKVRAIPDFRVGKQVVKGKPRPTEPFPVIVVAKSAIDAVIGARSVEERQRFLAEQKASGALVCGKRKHTIRLRQGDTLDGNRSIYAFRAATLDDVPRIRDTGKRRVFSW